ncbi:nucleotidyltransferase family protein [Stenomitos frigidus]|uniref:Signal peptidase n=1 Tax=Stenomitos frigidus ULC18 TaxID=2107698 RepID=A0A2T1DYJ9_9CYAN|nr:nucleotidyltransferase domain-containing protein [Stenomitos frigidus]PSB25593.1 signal peptidase [Stenomitos frigidus ULC18]
MVVPFDTRLLDEVLVEQQENREQERQQVLQQVLAWLEQSGSHYGIDSAYIFGSVLRPGRFHDGSDVDLGVETMHSVKQIEAIAALSMALLREVDIVDLRYCHFAHRVREAGLLWMRDS